MRTLRASHSQAADFAIDLFTHRVLREIGALTACIGGLDVLAFTGGIGEHDAILRQKVAIGLGYLRVSVDVASNIAARGDAVRPIHEDESTVEVWVIPTDEGRVAAQEALALCL
jgi:acetate kinase